MRTLSVEWARFGVRLVAVAVGQFDTETLRTKYLRAIVEGVAGTVPSAGWGPRRRWPGWSPISPRPLGTSTRAA